ncbi:tyrosine-type recombinase/integrase [Cupriavidus campinensis]
MASFSIREVRIETGERLPILVQGGPLGLPVQGVLQYTLTRLRARGLRRSSVRQRLDALALALDFLSSRGIDVVARTATQDYLSLEELVALADECRAPKQLKSSKTIVGAALAAVRYSTAIDFIVWTAEPVIGRILDPRSRESANTSLQRFLRRARSVAPKARGLGSTIDGERHGLLDEQRDLFLRVIRPGDTGNPFSANMRVRNYALLLLAYKLGARTGEIRGLKKVDLNFETQPAELFIVPRYNDIDDGRQDPAAAKTNGRMLYIDTELAFALEAWLKDRSVRERWPRANRNPYVFVNRFGDAMEGRGYRKIIETLRDHHPDLGAICHHVLRHDWNDRWISMMEDDSIEFEKAQQEQRYAMGWSNQSKMPLRYAKQAIAKAANNRILKLQTRSGASHE